MKLKVFVTIFLLLGLSFIVCIKRPKLQSEITIPLISQTLKVKELVDSNLLYINLDSTLVLFYESKIDTFRINDSLKVFDFSDSLGLALSDFVIEKLATAKRTLTLSEISGFNLPDTTIPFPPFDTTLTGQQLVLSNVEQLSIIEVVMKFEIINFTQLSFDSLRLTLSPFGSFAFGPIEPNQTVTRREYLQNINLTDSIIWIDINIASPGSVTPIRVGQSDSLRINVMLDSVRISSGTLNIPSGAMRANRLGVVSVPSNYRIHIDSVTFLSGNLGLTLQNQLPCPIQAMVQIKELDFDSTVFLPAASNGYLAVDFSGRSYLNPNPGLTPLSCSTEVTAQPTGQSIHFAESTGFHVAYSLANPKILNFTGTIFDTIKSRIRPDTLNLNLPQQLTNINIEQAELDAEIVSGLGFNALFYLNLNGYNDHGEQITIDTIIGIEPGSPSSPRTTSLLLDMAPLINILPTKIIFTGYRGVTGFGHAEAAAFFTGNYSFSTPLRLAFDSSTINLKSQEVNIEDKYRKDIERYLVSGQVTAKYINHFPFGLSGELKLENPNTNSVTIPFRVPVPEIDELTGIVSAPKETTITISLNYDQVNIFKQNSFTTSVSLFLPKTDKVTLTARDYFSVDYSNAKLKLNLLK
jgi:hypothetical protein